MKTIALIVALAASNFIYQAVFNEQPNWLTAIDRSYFQAIGVFVYSLLR